MCYMSFNIIKNSKYSLRDIVLTQVYHYYPSNPEGLGFYDGKKLFKTLNIISYTKEISNINSNFCFFHLRKATHGTVSEGNSHPYKLGNWICGHNGTFRLYSNNDKTDSFVFFQKIHKSLEKFEFDKIEKKLVEHTGLYSIIFCYNTKYNLLLVGSYGKLVRFTTTKNLDFVIISTDTVPQKAFITLRKTLNSKIYKLFEGLEFAEEQTYCFSLKKQINIELKEFSQENVLFLIDLNENKVMYKSNIQALPKSTYYGLYHNYNFEDEDETGS